MVVINEAEWEKKFFLKYDNFRDLWDSVKCPNIQIIGVCKEEDTKKGHEKISEEIIVSKNSQKCGRK